MSHPKDKAIMVKHLVQGYKCHERNSNPRSADQKHQSLCSQLLANDTPRTTLSKMADIACKTIPIFFHKKNLQWPRSYLSRDTLWLCAPNSVLVSPPKAQSCTCRRRLQQQLNLRKCHQIWWSQVTGKKTTHHNMLCQGFWARWCQAVSVYCNLNKLYGVFILRNWRCNTFVYNQYVFRLNLYHFGFGAFIW